MAGLYIHIPFCKQACHYCDFYFSTKQESRKEIIEAIAKELRLQKNYIKEELKTIYFGGGTPSLLTGDELAIILNAIHTNYSIAAKPEITLEANPDDLSIDKLSSFFQHGINRLSIGIQSFDDDVLKFLNRAHDTSMALKSIQDARDIGFSNISIDIIYAIPGQTAENWKKNIDQAIALAPQHISAYSLTIEEKTVFGRWQQKGKLKPESDDVSALQFEILMEKLKVSGYDHYEISNFCLPDQYSRHNSNYWKQEIYLGVGPSAHSYDQIGRQWNISNNVQYVRSLAVDKIPFEYELLRPENKINEYILTTLRTSWGCDLGKLKQEYQWDLVKENQQYLEDLVSKGLVSIEGDILRLTHAGKFLADKIASDLFADPIMDS